MKAKSKKSKKSKLKRLVPKAKASIYVKNNNYIVSDTFGSTPASPMARLEINPDNRSSVSCFIYLI